MPGLLARCRTALAEPSLAAQPPPPAAAGDALELRGDLWVVQGFGERVHVKTSRGMQLIARLCAEPGRELHVLDLADAAISGDAGPLLDERARAAYRTRLHELAAERDAAESACDLGRSERAVREIDALKSELERASRSQCAHRNLLQLHSADIAAADSCTPTAVTRPKASARFGGILRGLPNTPHMRATLEPLHNS
jgi:hypothetical protein